MHVHGFRRINRIPLKHNRVLLLCLMLLSAVHALCEDVTMDVSTKRRQLYIGESLVVTVRVSGLEDAGVTPDFSRLKNCRVSLLGSHAVSRSNIEVVNGRLVRSSFSGRVFSYRITPSKTGSLALGPITLDMDGRRVTAEGPKVNVVGLENQEWVQVSLSASHEAVLIDEPFDVELKVAIKKLPGRYASADPMNPNNPPSLTLPYLQDEPSGLVGPDIQRLLSGVLAKRRDQAGFKINDFRMSIDSLGSLFDLGFGSRRTPTRFALSREEEKRDGELYWVYKLTTRYVPKEEGEYTFGPALFKGSIFIGVTADRRGKERPIFAVGPAATVRVVPPPEEGRPESYVGVLGSNLTATAALDVQTCNVGDPLKLTVIISGEVNIEKLRPPPVWDQDSITRRFKVYEDGVQTERDDDQVAYTWTVRPKEPGTYEMPPIDVSFYNLAKRSYETVRTAAIPLRVNDVTVVGVDDVVNISTNGLSSGITIGGPETRSVAPLMVGSTGSLPDKIAGTKLQTALALTGPFIFLATLLGVQIGKVFRQRRLGYRPRAALGTALDRLSHAGDIAGEDTSAACREVSGALRGYLEDKSGAARGSMTPGEAGGLILNRRLDGVETDRISSLLEKYFNAGFSGGEVGADALKSDIHDAKEALRALEDIWKLNE